MAKTKFLRGSLRIIFFGTPNFAASVLDFLLQSKISIVAVVTQPDRPKGRALQVAPSAVKQKILEQAPWIPIFQPEKVLESQFLDQLRDFKADLFVVVAFGQILPQGLLDIPPKGCINVHASLLPKYRGAAPIQRVLMNGESETGISIQKIVKQLDAGDLIATARTEISENTTFGELEETLCELSKPLLLLVLQSYETGIPSAEPQNQTLATYAPKISIEEGEIRWDRSAKEIHNLVRAFSPRPGAWCWVQSSSNKRRIKILRTKKMVQHGLPGQILSADGIVACGSDSLKILEVQPEGKKN